jgi:aminocarboxymuconate-semialdehyde decarboxylase
MERGESWFGSQVSLDQAGIPVITTGSRRQAMGSARHPEPPEVRLERMDALGVDMQIVSVLPPLYRYELEPAVAIDAAQAVNDELADMQRRWPSRFAGLATLPMQDVNAAIRELERATGALGLRGISLSTHVNGRDWDAAELFPLLEAAAALNVFVLVHPAAIRGPDTFTRYFLTNLIGNPFETTLALGALIFGGVFDRLPNLKTCFVHGGGFISAAIGRFDRGRLVRKECMSIEQKPSDYVRQCYFDTLTHGRGGLRALVATVGPDHVVMGSDYPADMGDDDPAATVRSADWLTEAERQAIAGGTITRLLGLTAASAAD